MKRKVNQKKVKRLLALGEPVNKIARILGVPNSVITRIKNGKDVPYYVPKSKNKDKLKSNICECCGVRKKAPGFRKLCKWCYLHNGGGISEELPQHIPNNANM